MLQINVSKDRKLLKNMIFGLLCSSRDLKSMLFLDVFLLKDDELSSLKAKGLCLVPISFTVGVASSNGADIWAPIKTSPPNTRRSISDEASVITQI